jgi:hypothetical protein
MPTTRRREPLLSCDLREGGADEQTNCAICIQNLWMESDILACPCCKAAFHRHAWKAANRSPAASRRSCTRPGTPVLAVFCAASPAPRSFRVTPLACPRPRLRRSLFPVADTRPAHSVRRSKCFRSHLARTVGPFASCPTCRSPVADFAIRESVSSTGRVLSTFDYDEAQWVEAAHQVRANAHDRLDSDYDASDSDEDEWGDDEPVVRSRRKSSKPGVRPKHTSSKPTVGSERKSGADLSRRVRSATDPSSMTRLALLRVRLPPRSSARASKRRSQGRPSPPNRSRRDELPPTTPLALRLAHLHGSVPPT